MSAAQIRWQQIDFHKVCSISTEAHWVQTKQWTVLKQHQVRRVITTLVHWVGSCQSSTHITGIWWSGDENQHPNIFIWNQFRGYITLRVKNWSILPRVIYLSWQLWAIWRLLRSVDPFSCDRPHWRNAHISVLKLIFILWWYKLIRTNYLELYDLEKQ